MQDKNSKYREVSSSEGNEQDKNRAGTANQKQTKKENIEKPLKQKQAKGKTSFVCAGTNFRYNIIGTTFVVEDKFEYIKQIGHGAYGVVCSAYDHKSKTKVAIKKIPKAFEDLIDAKRIVREIKLLSKV